MCNQYHKVSAKNFWTMPLTRDYYMAKEGVKEQKNSPKSKQKKEAEGPDKRPKASQIDTVSSIVQRGSNNSSSSTIEKRRRSLRLRPRGLWKFTKLDKCVIDCCPLASSSSEVGRPSIDVDVAVQGTGSSSSSSMYCDQIITNKMCKNLSPFFNIIQYWNSKILEDVLSVELNGKLQFSLIGYVVFYNWII